MKGRHVVKESSVTSASRPRGQIVVVFALAAFAMIAMVGLILDGGGTFVQRRIQQNAADLASLAGANAWILDTNTATRNASAIAAARAVATQGGYTNGVDGATVKVIPAAYGDLGATVQVDIGAQHDNAFGSIVGMPTWGVSTTASAITGPGGSADGPSPIMFNVGVFNNGVQPSGIYADPANPYVFGDGNGDYPNNSGDIAWTDFAQPDNVNSNVVKNLIDGSDVAPREFGYGDYIGQENQGNHSVAFGFMNTYKSGQDVVVAIVDNTGHFLGWSLFHVVSADQGAKKLTGYFVSGFSENVNVLKCTNGLQPDGTPCPVSYSLFALKLVN
jgi:Flp pilus assembly protein TadG